MSLKRTPTEGVLFYPHCSAGSDRGLEITQRHAPNHRDGNKTRSLKGAFTTAQCCLLGLMQWGLAEHSSAPSQPLPLEVSPVGFPLLPTVVSAKRWSGQVGKALRQLTGQPSLSREDLELGKVCSGS